MAAPMDIYCSRPGCAQPHNHFPDVDTTSIRTTAVGQLFCQSCDMPLILDGRYVIEKPLAQGGFSITYLARDRRTLGMKRCVVKQLILHGYNEEQKRKAKELFEREGAILEELGEHPQIPDLLAFFELEVDGESFFYLVQEFIDGVTLEALINDFGPLPADDVIDILRNLLPVVQFVHNRGAIHRDIKPANIMVHRQTQVYYLLDFGAVKQIRSITDGHSQRSTTIYTPGYAAPEQIGGRKVYPATDIYGLGATAIFLLTGRHPDELLNTVTQRIEWRTHARRLNPDLADIIDRMVAPSLGERYESANAVLADLRQLNAAPAAPPPAPDPPQEMPIFEVARDIEIEIPQTKAKQMPAETSINKVAKSVNQIPLGSFILSGFGFGFQIGAWGVLLLGKGSQVMGPFTMFLLAGILLGLLFLRARNILDNKDMIASTLVTFVLFLLLKLFFRFPEPKITDFLAICLICGFGLVALLTMFRLVNQLLRSIL